MTTANETLKIVSNQSKRTFTIREYIDGKLFAKYRTIPTCKEEFESNEMMTERDWKHFLRNTDEYYKVN